MRDYDLSIAQENIVGGLLELQALGRVGPEIDPVVVATSLRHRYQALWTELTSVEEFGLEERWRIDKRIRHINQLGFDVEEFSISRTGDGLSVKPVLVDEGHHSRDLRRRTGLEVQENQARRLLADIEHFRAWLESSSGKAVPAAVAAARWLADVYEPLVESVPDDLRAKLEPAELFHQFLEHRYLLSEREAREVSNEEALADYLQGDLRARPQERQIDLDLE